MSLTVLCEIFLLMLRNCGPIFCGPSWFDQEGNEVTELLGLFHNLPFSVTRRTCKFYYEWKVNLQVDGEVYTILKDFEDNLYINGKYQCNGEDLSDSTFQTICDIVAMIEDYMEKI